MTATLVLALLTAAPASTPSTVPAPPHRPALPTTAIRPRSDQRTARGGQTQGQRAEQDQRREATARDDSSFATIERTGSGSVGERRRQSDEALPARGVERIARDGEGQKDAEDADQAEDPCQDRAEKGEPVGRHRDRRPWILAQLRALSPTAFGMVGSLGYLTIFGGMCLGGLLPRRWPRTAFLTGLTVSFSGIALLMLCYEASR